MSELGRIVTKKRTEANRRNWQRAADTIRAPENRLLAAAKAVSKGMTPTRAAIEVGKCRLTTLQAFLEKYNVPLRRYRKATDRTETRNE